jgi:hypothetical protein
LAWIESWTLELGRTIIPGVDANQWLLFPRP